jgi:hypothetical protein
LAGVGGYLGALMEARILFRRHYYLIVRVLALALLIAQLGAQAHAYSHLKQDPHGIPTAIHSCGQCASSFPLLTAIGAAPCIWLARPCQFEHAVPANTILTPYRPPHRAFQSRAPPGLL